MKKFYKLFGIIVLATIIGFSFAACSTETEDEVWLPYPMNKGIYENPQGTARISWENAGFVFSYKSWGDDPWTNNRKGWSEINYAGTKIRFIYTDTWSNGAWQSFTWSELYNYSYSGSSYDTGEYTFSGDGIDDIMAGTWVYKKTNGGGTGSKPAQLPSTATYQETVDKLNEIIAYCDKNPGPGNANDSLKSAAEAQKTQIALLESNWDTQGSARISVINTTIIDQLQ